MEAQVITRGPQVVEAFKKLLAQAVQEGAFDGKSLLMAGSTAQLVADYTGAAGADTAAKVDAADDGEVALKKPEDLAESVRDDLGRGHGRVVDDPAHQPVRPGPR